MSRNPKRDRVSALYTIGEQRLLPINKHHLVAISPKTQNQSLTFQAYQGESNLVLSGCAGVGKTFLALYLALRDVMDTSTPYEKVVIVRSTVATRDQGFLPGDATEKAAVFEMPYKSIMKELISPMVSGDIYEKLKAQKSLEFISTSYVRGITIDNAIIVVDEFSNMNLHELDSVITRIGTNSKIIFCGDTKQSDLHNDKLEHTKFLKILGNMGEFKFVEFGIDDIVRSKLVKSYLVAKYKLGY